MRRWPALKWPDSMMFGCGIWPQVFEGLGIQRWSQGKVAQACQKSFQMLIVILDRRLRLLLGSAECQSGGRSKPVGDCLMGKQCQRWMSAAANWCGPLALEHQLTKDRFASYWCKAFDSLQ